MSTEKLATINGAWSQQHNAWVSEIICLEDDCFLEVKLPGKGRLVIKKSESPNGPFPKALITRWGGPEFRIRCYGTTEGRYIQIYLTQTPSTIQISRIHYKRGT